MVACTDAHIHLADASPVWRRGDVDSFGERLVDLRHLRFPFHEGPCDLRLWQGVALERKRLSRQRRIEHGVQPAGFSYPPLWPMQELFSRQGSSWRGVGVRLCDHALDLGIHGGRRRRDKDTSMPGRRASAIRLAGLVGGNAVTACSAVSARGLEYVRLRSRPLRLAAGGLTRAFKQ